MASVNSPPFPSLIQAARSAGMSSTFQLDTATSRANPTPAPMKRLTVPAIRARKADGNDVCVGQYSSASMMDSTRMVTAGSEASGDAKVSVRS